MVFYAKTTSWIILPLILALFIGNFVTKEDQSQTLFFVCLMIGFGISCYGIYREIKEYKKGLDKEDMDKKKEEIKTETNNN